MSDIFYDRRGHEKYADEIIPLHQKGYFAILVKDEKVLVTYPPQVSVPEFPGGTVSRREDFRGCLYRKLYELGRKILPADCQLFCRGCPPFRRILRL